MPKFVYAPEGAAPREWPWEPFKMSSRDAIEIERRTGMKHREWADAVTDGSMLALQGFLYVMLRKETPGLQWDQIEFVYDDCAISLTDEEVVSRYEQLERLARTNSLTEIEGRMLAALRTSLDSDDRERVATLLDAEEAEKAGGGSEADPTQPPSELGSETATEQPESNPS